MERIALSHQHTRSIFENIDRADFDFGLNVLQINLMTLRLSYNVPNFPNLYILFLEQQIVCE